MIWSSVIAAVLCGALAAVLAAWLVRDRADNKTAHRVVFWIGFMVLFAIAKALVLPTVQSMLVARDLDAALKGNPALAALKRHDPAAYQGFADTAALAVQAGRPAAEVAAQMRALMGPLLIQRLPHASDEAVVGYIRANVQEVRELQAGGDDLCYRLLFPQGGPPANIAARVGEQAAHADLQSLARVIETAAVSPQPVPNMQDVQPLFAPIYGELVAAYGKPLVDGMATQRDPAARRRTCDMAVDLYSRVLALPVNDAGRVLRFMMAGRS